LNGARDAALEASVKADSMVYLMPETVVEKLKAHMEGKN
jgi:hypothetical protein